MKRFLASALICAAPLSILIAPPAAAQWTVYDPANHIQNIYQAIRSLQEVNQQIQQLTHEIEMLENMARDLEALPDSIVDDILRRMRRIEELMREAEGIGYRVEEIEREYEEVYPEDYGAEPPRQAVLVEEARARWRQSRTAYRDSLTVTAQVVFGPVTKSAKNPLFVEDKPWEGANRNTYPTATFDSSDKKYKLWYSASPPQPHPPRPPEVRPEPGPP